MPESTLALTYDQIRQRVGYDRGYGTVIEDWNDQAKENVEFCLRDGSAMFYTQANYEWSFLSPLVTITIAADTSEMELPWDFGFTVDDCIYFDDSIGRSLKIVNDGVVLKYRQMSTTTTGRPAYAAILIEGKPGTITGQSAKMIFWPTSDTAYDVQIRYSIMPNALSAATPVPYGGAAHSQTILEACLAASERLDGTPGVHNQLYAVALEASKTYDRRFKPRKIGNPKGEKWQPRNINPVTYV